MLFYKGIHKYIYIEREREREREMFSFLDFVVLIDFCLWIIEWVIMCCCKFG
jgi:hypothetical protein